MSEPRQVLWTGGWDSTYRVLDLVMRRQVLVQPHYIIGHTSVKEELLAMERIRAAIREKSPEAADRLLPTRFVHHCDLREDAGVLQQFRNLRRYFYIGEQYKWFARYVRQFGVQDLELCIHRDDKAHAALSTSASHVEDDCGGYYVVGSSPDYPAELFAPYRFPIFELTKLEMRDAAERMGWCDIMDHTWFCHTPTADGQPCGLCPPCLYTREEGMGYRIPAQNRQRQPTLKRKLRVFVRDVVCSFARFQRRILN